jgi:hypothetical protein
MHDLHDAKVLMSRGLKHWFSRTSYTLVEVMFAMAVSMAVIAAGMIIFIMIYQTSNDASKQIRVQRKADILIERLSRGPFGGFGGIRGAYVNTSLAGNALPNPVGGTKNPLSGSNSLHQTLQYYAQTNFGSWVTLGTAVTSLSNFQSQHGTNAGLYQIGYDSTNKWVYYSLDGGPQTPIVELEDVDLAYLRFSGGVFQQNIGSTYLATNNYNGTNYVFTNASNLIIMEFGLPYWTSDGKRRLTNAYSAKVYIRNNF